MLAVTWERLKSVQYFHSLIWIEEIEASFFLGLGLSHLGLMSMVCVHGAGKYGSKM
jgi:hypothetical protein